jgi:hypothetical protein
MIKEEQHSENINNSLDMPIGHSSTKESSNASSSIQAPILLVTKPSKRAIDQAATIEVVETTKSIQGPQLKQTIQPAPISKEMFNNMSHDGIEDSYSFSLDH